MKKNLILYRALLSALGGAQLNGPTLPADSLLEIRFEILSECQ